MGPTVYSAGALSNLGFWQSSNRPAGLSKHCLLLEFWCVWNQTIIYLCAEVLTQWQLWCVIKWVDMQNVYKVCEWCIHGSQSVLHVSSQVSSFSFMCKLNKILHMRLCMEKHGCVLLCLQQNIYEIRCCDITNKCVVQIKMIML